MSAIVFSENEIQLCKNAMEASYYMKDVAKELLTRLMDKNVITIEDTYVSVKNNANLVKVITNSIALGLDGNPETSKYGLKIVSDHDLYFNMSTDAEYNDFLANLRFDKNRPEFQTLKSNRFALRKFVFRTKNNLISEMELPETPDIRAPVKKAKTTPKSKADVAKDIEKTITKESAKTSVMSTDDDDDEIELPHAKSNLKDIVDIREQLRALHPQPDPLVLPVTSGQSKAHNVPLTRPFQIPSVKSSQPIIDPSLDAEEQMASSQELTNIALGLKNLIPDFKHGTTVLLRYDYPTHTIYLSLNEGTDWIGWEHTTTIPLCDSTIHPTDGSSTPSSISDVVSENDFENDSSIGGKMVRLGLQGTNKTGTAPNNKFRTVPCHTFAAKKLCRFGDKCHFKHG